MAWDFNPSLNCLWLISVERRCAGREFQTVGAATGKLRRPSSVLVRGTSIMSRRSAERRCARPEMSETGVQTCLKYAGPVPRIQSKAVAATLDSIRWCTGSQWSTSRGLEWCAEISRHQRQTRQQHSGPSVADEWLLLIPV